MKVQKEAEKVLKELSEALGEINLSETYYVVEDINITRSDGEAKVDKKFREIIKKNAPKLDEEGSFIMEVGKWVE
ncbi:MAG: Asp-tRNA(Asn) amidotransferase GatCAB subunit C [Euryarchaeota archaeon]|nr:Asp-tRNA(Asn) amidotransferase GatCAB subunit C [Euryarchaeota archaeon]